MSHAERDTLILKLFDWMEKLEERINKLENKIIKDSNNSSKPSSMQKWQTLTRTGCASMANSTGCMWQQPIYVHYSVHEKRGHL
ncbi:MAG: DUF6444 domain-containing protein [Methylococcaceae bacterium]